MEADFLLTRLRGRLTAEALREMASTESGMSCDCGLDYMDDGHGWNGVQQRILDALRPECEAIAREMAELKLRVKQTDGAWGLGHRFQERTITNLQTKLEQAEASRVALRQALQRLVEQSRRWQPKSEYYSWPHDFNAALKAAEALLAHEPEETT